MRKCYPLLLPLLALLVAATGCHRKPRLTKHPEGLVTKQSYLDFEFSTDMVPDEKVGAWTEEAYLKFEPELVGAYQWKTARHLRFQANQSLPGGTEYTIQATSLLPKIDPSDFPTIHFHTEPFQPLSAVVSWRNESYYSSHEAPVQANLEFNFEVEPSALREKMNIYKNGIKLTDYEISTWSASSSIEVILDLPDGADRPVNFRFEFKAGLVPTLDRSPLPRDTVIETVLSPITDLEITDVQVEGSSSERYIDLSFNQPVKAEILRPKFKLVPEIVFLLEQHGPNIRVRGDFKPGKTYGLRIDKDLKGLGGGTLDKNWGYSATMPSIKPFVRFADYSGFYLMRNGLENLRIQSNGLSEFEIKVYEIYENNLLHFLNDNSSLGEEHYYSSSEDYYYGYSYGADIDNYGREIYNDIVEVAQGKEDAYASTVVHLKKQLRSKYRGIFVMEIARPGEYWADDAKMVSLSDLGIVARRHGREMLVFVNSLSTARPVAGARVQLISETNQTMFTASTDADGVARFPNIDALGEGFDERLVYVTSGGDYNFLDLDLTEIDVDRFDLSGKSHREWDAYAWSDRNLYRPGDTAHVACLIRDWDYKVQEGMPVIASVYGPGGSNGDPLKYNTQKGGAIAFDLPLSSSDMTGTYTIDFRTATENYLTSLEFHVEDFVPDKIRVAPRSLQPAYHRGDTAQVLVEAEYYFGAPCDSHYLETRFVFATGAYQSQRYPDFDFHNPNSEGPGSVNLDRHLHKNGRDTVPLPIPAEWEYFGPIYANALATVHDNTGRTVTRKTSFLVHTQENYIGLRKPKGSYLSMGDAVQMEIVAVSPQADSPADSFPLVVRVMKQFWHNSVRQVSYDYVHESQNVGEQVYADTLLQNGRPLNFSYRIQDPGVYRVEIGRVGSPAEHDLEYLVYGKGAEYASSFATDREGTVHITPNKDEYKVGENARIHFATPFAGRMLVTMERDRVIRYQYVDVPRNSTEITIPITEDMVPNVVVSTTLFHPMRGKSPLPFTVSHGYKSLKVDQPAHDMPVQLRLPERAYPGQRTYATVQTSPNAYLVVAAVDEGILAIKQFKTPDPYPYFYAARELRVEAFDMYKFLLPEIQRLSPATGGDMGGGYSGLNPFQIRRFRPVAIWSGIVRANASGVAKVPLDVHAGFNGKVRVMAVAWQGRRFGSGDGYLKVHEDLVVQAGIPRLLSYGDSVHIPVHVLNTTDKVAEGLVSMELEGPLKLKGAAEIPVKVLGHGTQRTSFAIRTTDALGKATIRIKLRQGKRTTMQETELAVRAAGHLEKSGGHGVVEAGQARQITFPSGFHPETQLSRLSVNNFPAMEFSGQLRDLLLYPHGCTEQTVSKLFPQLYFKDLAELSAPEAFESGNAVMHIRDGIQTILERQDYNGGFGYWSPADADDWLTVYTVHFLLEAQKAGFPVREDALKSGIERVAAIAAIDGRFSYAHAVGGTHYTREVAPKERIYALYVLAMVGKPETSLMNYYKSHLGELSGDGRYLLAAAYALAGDPASYQAVLPKSWAPETTERLHSHTLDSELRPSAIMLNALLSADPGHPFVPNIVEYLARNADRAYSTQDKAWIFLGLGKAAKGQAPEKLKIELIHDGKVLQSADGKGFSHHARALAGETVTLKVSGQGRAYYSWEGEGVPQGANFKPRRKVNGMKLERDFFTTEGQQIVKPYFEQGELIVCRIRLTTERDLENVAITDLIAGGMEVENQRLSSSDYGWVAAPVQTLDAQDVRDGGIVTYTGSTQGKPQTFYYLIRPVNVGRFHVPPVVADAMYDSRLYAFDEGFQAWVYPAETKLPPRLSPKKLQAESAVAEAQGNSMMQWWQASLEKARRQ